MNTNVHTPTTSLVLGKDTIDIKISISIDDLLNAAVVEASVTGRPRKLKKEHERLLNALIKTGVQAEDIAEAFGISRATFYRYRQRLERNQSGGLIN